MGPPAPCVSVVTLSPTVIYRAPFHACLHLYASCCHLLITGLAVLPCFLCGHHKLFSKAVDRELQNVAGAIQNSTAQTSSSEEETNFSDDQAGRLRHMWLLSMRDAKRREKGLLRVFAMRPGIVGIRGVKSELYLCMNQEGIAHGMKKFSNECLFKEQMEENHYNTYSSLGHPGFFLALSQQGKLRKGNKVGRHKASTHFLLRKPLTH
ncbi:fibroblast growth factor 7 [Pseudorasbora parva]|uniref:fibroblast growth factor 7 n=1 Tax=Pseudorasbora parva TaxID=51549 RepID=UPI00351F1FA9